MGYQLFTYCGRYVKRSFTLPPAHVLDINANDNPEPLIAPNKCLTNPLKLQPGQNKGKGLDMGKGSVPLTPDTDSVTSDDTDDSDSDSEEEDLLDAEIRRLAETGGDVSSDEDYRSELRSTEEAYRKSFFSLRSKNHGSNAMAQPKTTEAQPLLREPAVDGQESTVGSTSPTDTGIPSLPAKPTTSGQKPPANSPSQPKTGFQSLPKKPAVASQEFTINFTWPSGTRTLSLPKKPVIGDRKSTTSSLSQPGIAAADKVADRGNCIRREMDTGIRPANTQPMPTPAVQTERSSANSSSPVAKGAVVSFELSQYAYGPVTWTRANPKDACIQLFYSEDKKSLLSKDGPAGRLKVDPELFSGFIRHYEDERNANGIVTLLRKDATGPIMRLVFDRGEGSSVALGKKQARWFIGWLREHGIKPV